jgi:hypothetical protein
MSNIKPPADVTFLVALIISSLLRLYGKWSTVGDLVLCYLSKQGGKNGSVEEDFVLHNVLADAQIISDHCNGAIWKIAGWYLHRHEFST